MRMTVEMTVGEMAMAVGEMAVGEEDFGFDRDHIHSSLYFSYVVLVGAAVTVLVDLTSSRLLERGFGSRLPLSAERK